ncbi:hypothetical protein [Clostridium tunisiense]|nr:hypothetical protein [Clostridium tunisiense]
MKFVKDIFKTVWSTSSCYDRRKKEKEKRGKQRNKMQDSKSRL